MSKSKRVSFGNVEVVADGGEDASGDAATEEARIFAPGGMTAEEARQLKAKRKQEAFEGVDALGERRGEEVEILPAKPRGGKSRSTEFTGEEHNPTDSITVRYVLTRNTSTSSNRFTWRDGGKTKDERQRETAWSRVKAETVAFFSSLRKSMAAHRLRLLT